jgi:hypothetical protein
MGVLIVKLIHSIFVTDSLQFVDGAVETQYTNHCLANSVIMEIQQLVMAAQTPAK